MMTVQQFLNNLALPWLDVLALVWFALSWVFYVWYTDSHVTEQHTLSHMTGKYIRDWMARMVERDNRMLDVNIVRNLSRSSQFFASTTMLILGALVALMGYTEKAAGVLAELPFAQQVSERVWEIKILLLVLIFVYAFFKFSWSIRQFGLCSIMVGATRKPPQDAEEYAAHIDRLAVIIVFANGNFNNGLRAYYFGVAALSWFMHPVLFMMVTFSVVCVLYQREFRSRTLQTMIGG